MRTNRGRLAAFAIAVLAVLAAGVLVDRATDGSQVDRGVTPSATVAAPSPSPTGSPSAAPSESPASTPTASATPRTFATPNPAQVESFVPPRTRGIGQLAGDWVFLLRRSTLFGSIPRGSGVEDLAPMDRAVDELTLVPVGGPESAAVVVASFLSNLGDGIVATNLVGAQLSPGGDRLVLSAGTPGPQGGVRLGLVIIDLATGNSFSLTTDPSYHDDTPAWSPDGQQIAFTRRSITTGADAGIWIVAARSGAAPRGPLLDPVSTSARRSFVYSWPPGGWLAMSRGSDRYEFVLVPPERCPAPPSVCAGPNVADLLGTTIESRAIADWRQSTPQFIGIFGERGEPISVQIADQATAERRVVVRAANANVLLQRPRWRPGSDEFLYLETQLATGPRTTRLELADTRSGARREVLSQPMPFWAEWTPAGDEIAWVEAIGVAVAVRVVRADGTGERVILGMGGVPEGEFLTVDFGTLRF